MQGQGLQTVSFFTSKPFLIFTMSFFTTLQLILQHIGLPDTSQSDILDIFYSTFTHILRHYMRDNKHK